MNEKNIKIFIAEEIPSGNKGEVAILKGIRESLIAYGIIPEITVLSPFYPDKDKREYGYDFRILDGCKSLHIPYGLTEKDIPTKILISFWCFLQHLLFLLLYILFRNYSLRLMKSEIWREYIETDLLIVGHDNLFANTFGSPLLFMNSYQILLAKALKKHCIVLGASIGPFNNRLLKPIFKFILGQASIITLREKYSYEYSKTIGIEEKKLILATDPAVMLKASSEERILEIIKREKIDDRKPHIALMIGSYLFRYFGSNSLNKEERYRLYISRIASSIDRVIDDLHVEFILMYHTTFPSDDRVVIKDVFKAIRRKDSVKIIENNYSVEELKGLISKCDLFIGERTHSLISALTLCIPSIAISHKGNFKTNGIVGELFESQNRIIYIEGFDEDAFVHLIEKTWCMRKEIHNSLINKLPIALIYAKRNVDAIKKILNL